MTQRQVNRNLRTALTNQATAIATVIVAFYSAGCAHQLPRSSRDFSTLPAASGKLEIICRAPDEGVSREISGSVGVTLSSPEGSGRFVAQLRVVAPSDLDLEVTNLLGGTEGSLQIRGHRYWVREPGKEKKVVESGRETWRGIPLIWATALFLGDVPCPVRVSAASSGWAPAEWIGESELLVAREQPQRGSGALPAIETESFLYRFADDGQLNFVRWHSPPDRSDGPVLDVEFDFLDWGKESSGFLYASKWRARSNRGEILVRWKERNSISPSAVKPAEK